MSEDLDVKRCGNCGAWIPTTATKCAYCDTSAPDQRSTGAPRRVGPRGGSLTVTKVLIGANAAYLIFSLLVAYRMDPRGNVLQMLLTGSGLEDGMAAAGWYRHTSVRAGEWWRVMTAPFLHAGLIHFALNMWALHQLGHLAEHLFGRAKFLALYLLCGASSSLAISVWFAHVLGDKDPTPVVGASGAIFGVGGLLSAFLVRRGSAQGRAIGYSLLRNLLFLLVLGFLMTFISNTGHVGGLVPGLLFGWFVREQFSTRINPSSRSAWALAAGLCVAVTVVSLWSGVLHSIQTWEAVR